MKTIIILTILLSINLYGEYKLSVKGGINYSTAEVVEVEVSPDKVHYPGYGFRGVLFISCKKDINNKFNLEVELGLNQKGYDGGNYHSTLNSLELPIILGYRVLNSLNLYSGIYGSLVFSSDRGWGFLNGDGLNNDHGFLLGIEYNYRNILFNLRFQKGYGNLSQSNHEEKGPYITNSQQFLFMVGYQFF